jgi:hypothetical protein
VTGQLYFRLDSGQVIRINLAPIWLRPSWTREDYADVIEVCEFVGESGDAIPCVRIPGPPR